VLALLALASFPGLAQAEESSGIQYESEVENSGVDKGSTIPQVQKSPKAETSTASPGANGGGTDAEEGSEGNGSGGAGGNDGPGKGSEGNGSAGSQGADGAKDSGGISDSQALASNGGPTTAASSDGGGSSPLVPILIAVVLLAGISVGVVLYRQRRQGTGSSISPKAS
jgi:cobalamin biosynthesis Mg chelatase CobN